MEELNTLAAEDNDFVILSIVSPSSNIEVRSRSGDSHLGHVFNESPKEKGHLRHCINSASILFIPQDEMEAQEYGYLERKI